MKALIRTTLIGGKPFWINPDYIATLTSNYDNTGSVICIGNDPNPVLVQEQPDTILQIISSIQ